MSPPPKVRTRCLIRGHVQGVWFRESTREQAERAGLVGWVRNLPNGDVEAVFEGAREAVDEVVRWCHRGPPSARVETVEVREEPPKGEPAFRVVR